MMRIGLFLLTNLAVLVVVGIVLSLLGIGSYHGAGGLGRGVGRTVATHASGDSGWRDARACGAVSTGVENAGDWRARVRACASVHALGLFVSAGVWAGKRVAMAARAALLLGQSF